MKNSTKELQLRPVVDKAIEIYGTTPMIEHQQVAEMLDISEGILLNIRRDPNFWTKVYDFYMVSFEGDIVDVLRAMVREAKAGNVQAGRLVLEHSGKLQKNINITIDSPFEKWMKKIDGDIEIEDAEIIDDIKALPDDFGDLPPRSEEKGTWKERKDHSKKREAISKAERKKKRSEARKIMYKWQKRANAVGVDPLPAKRPTPGQRREWEKSIIAKEKQASK
tara:strand:- start:12 stop:677 length:666 start_codon:yes stop_codon:yes gene_type:complete